jgi:serine/threonine protein kinase
MITSLTGLCSAQKQQGWIHRDIKLENILIDPDTQIIKLADFGLAVNVSDTEGIATRLCGTPSCKS